MEPKNLKLTSPGVLIYSKEIKLDELYLCVEDVDLPTIRLSIGDHVVLSNAHHYKNLYDMMVNNSYTAARKKDIHNLLRQGILQEMGTMKE